VQLSENLRLQLEQHSFPVVGHKPSSFGVICFVKDNTIHSLILRCDKGIFQEEGLEQVTIRKFADKAGYNSATFNNYFLEISHLLFFATMRCMQDYTNELLAT